MATRVLVADDEPAIRTLCRVNLQLEGIEVLEAENGNAALEAVAREHPDLLLLDLMMPELDGWQVAQRLGSSNDTRDLPIVVLSARASREDIERAHDAGAVGYVIKPFDPVGLAGRLERTLKRLAAGEREDLRREMLEAP
ncbi:MAG TPA: response regulator [Gaiellaceae bacterium]|jgi:CheY-like chemotaxis protein|nr:response regulator [Gaiellaceae bacterium]